MNCFSFGSVSCCIPLWQVPTGFWTSSICVCVYVCLLVVACKCIAMYACFNLRKAENRLSKGGKGRWKKSAAGGKANRPTSTEHTFRDNLFESIVHSNSQFTCLFKSLACFCSRVISLYFFSPTDQFTQKMRKKKKEKACKNKHKKQNLNLNI